MVLLVFAKTPAGEAEIATWAEGDPLRLTDAPSAPPPDDGPEEAPPPSLSPSPPLVTALPPVVAPLPQVPMEDDSPDDPPDTADGADLGGVLGGALLALGLFALAL